MISCRFPSHLPIKTFFLIVCATQILIRNKLIAAKINFFSKTPVYTILNKKPATLSTRFRTPLNIQTTVYNYFAMVSIHFFDSYFNKFKYSNLYRGILPGKDIYLKYEIIPFCFNGSSLCNGYRYYSFWCIQSISNQMAGRKARTSTGTKCRNLLHSFRRWIINISADSEI